MKSTRQRVLTFRLTEEEFLSVKIASASEGARCVSEYARSLLLTRPRADRLSSKMHRMEERLAAIEANLERIMIAMGSTRC